MSAMLKTTMSSGYRHNFSIYDSPAILEEIPTVLVWNQNALVKLEKIQQDYDDRRWDSRYVSMEPGRFASEHEYRFYRLYRGREACSKYLLLSNVPLESIIAADRGVFEEWYARQGFMRGARDNAFDRYARLVGAKSVDLIVVDKATGQIVQAVEVDGEAHRTDEDQISRDHVKSYHFKMLQIPLLRISTDSVVRLWSTAASDGHPAKFEAAFDNMLCHWQRFVSDPSIATMHLHFASPVVPV